MSTAAARIQEIGVTLPASTVPPGALYVPYTVSGNTVYVSGQLPMVDGKPFMTGHLGKGVTLADGQETARVCAINVLAHLKAACGGDLSRVKKVNKLEILVAASPDFHEPHVVANGASKLFIDVFGAEVGAHARVAYGVAVLPLNVSVEVAGTFEIA